MLVGVGDEGGLEFKKLTSVVLDVALILLRGDGGASEAVQCRVGVPRRRSTPAEQEALQEAVCPCVAGDTTENDVFLDPGSVGLWGEGGDAEKEGWGWKCEAFGF